MPHAWSRPGCVPGLPRPAGAHPTMGVGLRHSKGAGATRVPGGCPIMLCAPRALQWAWCREEGCSS